MSKENLIKVKINKIPEDKFFDAEQFTYITEELFKQFHIEEDWKIFTKWMTGQTCSIVNDKIAIYSWDYERWISQGKKEKQGIDWD